MLENANNLILLGRGKYRLSSMRDKTVKASAFMLRHIFFFKFIVLHFTLQSSTFIMMINTRQLTNYHISICNYDPEVNCSMNRKFLRTNRWMVKFPPVSLKITFYAINLSTNKFDILMFARKYIKRLLKFRGGFLGVMKHRV